MVIGWEKGQTGGKADSPRRLHRREALLLHPGSWVEGLRLESQASCRAPHMHRAQHRHLLLLLTELSSVVAAAPFRISLDFSPPSFQSTTRSPHCTGAACQLAPGRADPESETGGGGGTLTFKLCGVFDFDLSQSCLAAACCYWASALLLVL